MVKALLEKGERNQDIQYLINIGREKTTNGGRITEVKKSKTIKPASEEDLNHFKKVKESYNFKTNLNPYIDGRLVAAREAMISAVQIFNSPLISFRSNNFAVLANIAWTNALHEYYVRQGKPIKTNSEKTLPLSKMCRQNDCPLDEAVIANLEALKKIRDTIEHEFLLEADYEYLPLYQACCLNFNDFLVKYFGERTSIASEMGLVLQFANIDFHQLVMLGQHKLPTKIEALNRDLEKKVSAAISENLEYKFRVVYTHVASSKGEAHFQFLRPDSDTGKAVINIIEKHVSGDERYPYKPGVVCRMVEEKSTQNFSLYDHTLAWKKHKCRPKKGVGNPEATNKAYCIFHKAHGDYTYNDAWVELLVAELS